MMSIRALTIFSVCKAKNFAYSFNIQKNGKLKMNNRINKVLTNRQDHQQFFTVNGALYASFSEHFQSVKTFLAPESYTYQMPIERSIDIDEMEDWYLAEKLFPSS